MSKGLYNFSASSTMRLGLGCSRGQKFLSPSFSLSSGVNSGIHSIMNKEKFLDWCSPSSQLCRSGSTAYLRKYESYSWPPERRETRLFSFVYVWRARLGANFKQSPLYLNVHHYTFFLFFFFLQRSVIKYSGWLFQVHEYFSLWSWHHSSLKFSFY